MLYAAAILYASLVLGPDGLHYVALDPGEAWRRFRAIAFIGNASDQRADWIANMLMTIPLGYCLRGILTPNGGERRADALTLLVSPHLQPGRHRPVAAGRLRGSAVLRNRCPPGR